MSEKKRYVITMEVELTPEEMCRYKKDLMDPYVCTEMPKPDTISVMHDGNEYSYTLEQASRRVRDAYDRVAVAHRKLIRENLRTRGYPLFWDSLVDAEIGVTREMDLTKPEVSALDELIYGDDTYPNYMDMVVSGIQFEYSDCRCPNCNRKMAVNRKESTIYCIDCEDTPVKF